MPLNQAQIEAGHAVKRALAKAEAAHPNSLALHRLHCHLAALRDSFEADLAPEEFVAFGGGTPKTLDPDDE